MGNVTLEKNRHSIRLKNYDYSGYGAYFVTICVDGKRFVLGEVLNGKVVLSKWGEIVKEEWSKTAKIRKNVKLDEYVIMPNHVHGIIWIVDDDKAKGNDVGAIQSVVNGVGAIRWVTRKQGGTGMQCDW